MGSVINRELESRIEEGGGVERQQHQRRGSQQRQAVYIETMPVSDSGRLLQEERQPHDGGHDRRAPD